MVDPDSWTTRHRGSERTARQAPVEGTSRELCLAIRPRRWKRRMEERQATQWSSRDESDLQSIARRRTEPTVLVQRPRAIRSYTSGVDATSGGEDDVQPRRCNRTSSFVQTPSCDAHDTIHPTCEKKLPRRDPVSRFSFVPILGAYTQLLDASTRANRPPSGDR